jgi:hypothetical protein
MGISIPFRINHPIMHGWPWGPCCMWQNHKRPFSSHGPQLLRTFSVSRQSPILLKILPGLPLAVLGFSYQWHNIATALSPATWSRPIQPSAIKRTLRKNFFLTLMQVFLSFGLTEYSGIPLVSASKVSHRPLPHGLLW